MIPEGIFGNERLCFGCLMAPEGYYYLGEAYKRKGEMDLARQSYQ